MNHLPQLLSLENSTDPIRVLEEEFNLYAYETTRARKLLEQQRPPLVRRDMLAYLLGVSDGLIESMTRFQKRNYRIYRIPKSTGGYRRIEAPRSYLKLIQSWIYESILRNIELPDYITGFVKGKNIFDNANRHLESKNLLVIDIKDFFS